MRLYVPVLSCTHSAISGFQPRLAYFVIANIEVGTLLHFYDPEFIGLSLTNLVPDDLIPCGGDGDHKGLELEKATN